MNMNYRALLLRSAFLLIVAFTATVCAIVILKAVAASRSTLRSTEANQTHTLPVSMSAPAEHLEAEVITLSSTGFQPTEITRPAGKFLIAIENRSGLQHVDFNLRAGSGSRIFEVSRTWERSDWSDVVNPAPGKYVLSEANHPTWQCVITITP